MLKALFMLSMVLAMTLSIPLDLKFYFYQDPRCDELIEITVTKTLTKKPIGLNRTSRGCVWASILDKN